MDFKQDYFDLWAKAWNFHKRFSGMSGTDEDWKEVISESERIVNQYDKTVKRCFVQSLLLAVIKELERERKEDEKNG